METNVHLFPTSLVGSYAQPDWIIDRKKLASRFPPRTRVAELWRVDAEFLEDAQNDATLLAIREQERAGLDIITDGEIRRESYSNRFANALEGIDLQNPGHGAGPLRAIRMLCLGSSARSIAPVLSRSMR